ncbi:MAG: hypothetical protein WCW77_00355 [Patescibacteria group bacterium]
MNQFDFTEVVAEGAESGNQNGLIRGLCIRGEHRGEIMCFSFPQPVQGKFFWTVERSGEKILSSEKWEIIRKGGDEMKDCCRETTDSAGKNKHVACLHCGERWEKFGDKWRKEIPPANFKLEGEIYVYEDHPAVPS